MKLKAALAAVALSASILGAAVPVPAQQVTGTVGALTPLAV
jgi:hypothetical protein